MRKRTNEPVVRSVVVQRDRDVGDSPARRCAARHSERLPTADIVASGYGDTAPAGASCASTPVGTDGWGPWRWPALITAADPAVAAASAPNAHPMPHRSRPRAASKERLPGPTVTMVSSAAVITSGYSNPPLSAHMPFGRCTVQVAVSITDIRPAAAAGVARPNPISAPLVISLPPAANAIGLPGRRPIDSKNWPVPSGP